MLVGGTEKRTHTHTHARYLLVCLSDGYNVKLQVSPFLGGEVHKFFQDVGGGDVVAEERVGEDCLVPDDLQDLLECAAVFWPLVLIKRKV